MMGRTTVEPSIRRHPRSSLRPPKATPMTFPSMIPKALMGGQRSPSWRQVELTHVHICHIMTRAPRIGAGEHSAAYTGTVVDLEPIPSPKTKRARKRLTHELATPSHCAKNLISHV